MSSKTCFAKSSCIVLASAFFCTSLPALAASSTAGTNLAIQQQDQKLKGQVIDAQTRPRNRSKCTCKGNY